MFYPFHKKKNKNNNLHLTSNKRNDSTCFLDSRLPQYIALSVWCVCVYLCRENISILHGGILVKLALVDNDSKTLQTRKKSNVKEINDNKLGLSCAKLRETSNLSCFDKILVYFG